MDTSNLIIQYSAGDFADATRGLLPEGEYWQDTENEDLTNVINGMAKDFKQTHDDIELSLLTEFEEQLFGWRLPDYQSLLGSMGSDGLVYDDVKAPNLIKINLYSYDNDAAFKAFEDIRLPHNEFHWIYPLDAETQFMCNIAITWQLEIGDTA